MASVMVDVTICQNGQIGIKKSTASVVLPLRGKFLYSSDSTYFAAFEPKSANNGSGDFYLSATKSGSVCPQIEQLLNITY